LSPGTTRAEIVPGFVRGDVADPSRIVGDVFGEDPDGVWIISRSVELHTARRIAAKQVQTPVVPAAAEGDAHAGVVVELVAFGGDVDVSLATIGY